MSNQQTNIRKKHRGIIRKNPRKAKRVLVVHNKNEINTKKPIGKNPLFEMAGTVKLTAWHRYPNLRDIYKGLKTKNRDGAGTIPIKTHKSFCSSFILYTQPDEIINIFL
jgi:hypothetical protein